MEPLLRQRVFFASVIAAGTATTIVAAVQLYVQPVGSEWTVLAALTLLTGSFTVNIPRLSIRVSVSDAFVFASVLLYGAPAATVIVAIDSLVATLWMRPQNRSLFRSLFNLSVASLSIWIAASAFFWLAGPISKNDALVLTELLGPLFVLAASYFTLNSWLIAFALAIEKRTNVVALWWAHFPWFSLNYFGGVSAAALLVSYTRSVDIGAVSVIVPLLLISYLTYRTALGRIEDSRRHVDQVNELYMSTIETLAMAVDAKDQITHGHIRRVQVYATELAKRLGVSDDRQLKAIAAAALLHDMGKLAIPEHILNKPGPLTTSEFERMKRHADLGADLLSSIRFPYPVVPIVRHHHENWDGTGYPSRIAGTDIPLGARVLSVVDCFDALTSDRPYRPRLSDEDAFAILRERRGTMYDPLVVDTFLRAFGEIAPAAIKAGQEARSIFPIDGSIIPPQDFSRPLRQIRANATEAQVLGECALKLARVASVDAAQETIGQCLRQLTPATVFALYRYRPESDTLICESTAGDEGRLLRGFVIRAGQRITGWTAATRQLCVNSDAVLDLAQIAEMFVPPLRSALAVPLMNGDRLTGVLTLYSPRENGFDESHTDIGEGVALLLAEKLKAFGSGDSSIVSFPIRQNNPGR